LNFQIEHLPLFSRSRNSCSFFWNKRRERKKERKKTKTRKKKRAYLVPEKENMLISSFFFFSFISEKITEAYVVRLCFRKKKSAARSSTRKMIQRSEQVFPFRSEPAQPIFTFYSVNSFPC